MYKPALYEPEGWVNAQAWFDDPAPFIIAVGGRGTGKTYGVLKYIIDHGIPFVYMRRKKTQLNALKYEELNPFRNVNIGCGTDIVPKPIGEDIVGFYHESDGTDQKSLGIGIALSTFATIRGVDGTQYEILLYDEFIPERHERAIKYEGEAMLNAVESLNRNRELTGLPPMKVIMLSNSNSLKSPILKAFGALEPMESMIRSGKDFKSLHGGYLSVYRYRDSPISKKKKDTALYRVANSDDFVKMAIGNEFAAANYENVRPQDIRHYNPLVAIGGITIYEHKTEHLYYVVKGMKCPNVYSTLPADRKGFASRYWYLLEASYDRRVLYASASVKISFEEVWQKNE